MVHVIAFTFAPDTSPLGQMYKTGVGKQLLITVLKFKILIFFGNYSELFFCYLESLYWKAGTQTR